MATLKQKRSLIPVLPLVNEEIIFPNKVNINSRKL